MPLVFDLSNWRFKVGSWEVYIVLDDKKKRRSGAAWQIIQHVNCRQVEEDDVGNFLLENLRFHILTGPRGKQKWETPVQWCGQSQSCIFHYVRPPLLSAEKKWIYSTHFITWQVWLKMPERSTSPRTRRHKWHLHCRQNKNKNKNKTKDQSPFALSNKEKELNLSSQGSLP